MRTIRRTGPRPVIVGRLVLHHAGTHWHQRRLRSSYPRMVAVTEAPELRLPLISLERAPSWPDELGSALEDLLREREAAMRHTVDLLGSGPVALGEEIDWHRDFKSGFRWPEVFYQDVVVTRLDDDSDAKVPWELSRCHHWLALGRAAAIFEDEAAAAELEQQLRAWIIANPPGVGINWTNAMEVAIRAINWVWAIAALESLRPMEAQLRTRVARSLAEHGRHIWHNLEGSPELRSNHYLSDIVGLLVLGSVLAGDPLAPRWTEYARAALEREARSQILPDGVDFESSLSYHGLVLELMLVARLAAVHAGRPFSLGFDEILGKMLAASLVLRHPDGRIPQFGDCDSGRVLPASWRRPPTHDHLLWIGAATLGTSAPETGLPHEEVAFNIGVQTWREVAAASERAIPSLPGCRSFPEAGIHVLRTPRSHLAVRCGDVGQNGNGGHSHNDLLSFELSFGGRLVIADPGTYLYTSDPGLRNAFRGTAAHSTVMISEEEINPVDANELFRLPRWARPLPFAVHESDSELQLECAHDGYRRFSPPAIVRRRFVLDRRVPGVTVVDAIEGAAERSVASRLQLAPKWQAENLGKGSFRLRVGKTSIWFEPFGHSAVAVEQGWVSPRFGVREPSSRLRIDAKIGQRVRFGYRLRLEEV